MHACMHGERERAIQPALAYENFPIPMLESYAKVSIIGTFLSDK